MVGLIIDDSRVVRTMYSNILHRIFENSIELYEAGNGQEGLDKLNQLDKVDLIILDINMPIMKGDELLKKIRSNPAFNKIKIIISTTEGERQFVKNMMKDGANSYIVKPFNRAKAEKAIRVAFRMQ